MIRELATERLVLVPPAIGDFDASAEIWGDPAVARFIGEVGFGDFRRGLGSAFDDDPECGWALSPWAWGKGYAAEAILAALDWTTANLNADRTVCMIHPDNQPSIKLAAKCGFRTFAEAVYKGAPTLLFQRQLRT